MKSLVTIIISIIFFLLLNSYAQGQSPAVYKNSIRFQYGLFQYNTHHDAWVGSGSNSFLSAGLAYRRQIGRAMGLNAGIRHYRWELREGSSLNTSAAQVLGILHVRRVGSDWRINRFTPYVGLGIGTERHELERNQQGDTSFSNLYIPVEAGIAFNLGNRWSLGLFGEYKFAAASGVKKLAGIPSGKLDIVNTAGISLSWHFGKKKIRTIVPLVTIDRLSQDPVESGIAIQSKTSPVNKPDSIRGNRRSESNIAPPALPDLNDRVPMPAKEAKQPAAGDSTNQQKQKPESKTPESKSRAIDTVKTEIKMKQEAITVKNQIEPKTEEKDSSLKKNIIPDSGADDKPRAAQTVLPSENEQRKEKDSTTRLMPKPETKPAVIKSSAKDSSMGRTTVGQETTGRQSRDETKTQGKETTKKQPVTDDSEMVDTTEKMKPAVEKINVTTRSYNDTLVIQSLPVNAGEDPAISRLKESYNQLENNIEYNARTGRLNERELDRFRRESNRINSRIRTLSDDGDYAFEELASLHDSVSSIRYDMIHLENESDSNKTRLALELVSLGAKLDKSLMELDYLKARMENRDREKADNTILSKLMQQQQDFEKALNELREENKTLSRALQQKQEADIKKTEEKREAILQTIYFKVNSHAVGKKEMDALKKLADSLKMHDDRMIVLSGFADPSGNADYNLRLSKRRVESVKKVLLSSGMDENRLEERYYGSGQAGRGSPENDRRVEIRLNDR